jgi:hypothetical protein
VVLVHGRILTVDAHDSIAEAIAIRDGRILRVGTNADILAMGTEKTRVIDLHGRTATPGLIDAHGHFADGGVNELYHLDLSKAASIAEVRALVQQKVATLKPGEWLLGDGWDESKLAELRYLHAADLDGLTPQNPHNRGSALQLPDRQNEQRCPGPAGAGAGAARRQPSCAPAESGLWTAAGCGMGSIQGRQDLGASRRRPLL